MKKLMLLGFTVLLIVACQQEQRYFFESPEIEVVKASISDYNNGDWESWKAHFADTAKLYVNSLKSISAVDLENAQKELLSNFSSFGFQDKGTFIEMVIDKDDETWVNYWANWHAKFKANGKEVDVPVHFTAQFVDGKIVELHDYFDGTELNNEIASIAKMTDMDKTIHTQIEVLIDSFTNKQDFSVLGDLIADGHVRYINDVKVAAGPTELQESMAPYFTGFPDFKIELLHKSPIMNNAIFIHWKLTGTNDGEFAGSPATGKKVDVNGLSRLHFNDKGKMDMEHIHFDQLQLMEQLGKTLK